MAGFLVMSCYIVCSPQHENVSRPKITPETMLRVESLTDHWAPRLMIVGCLAQKMQPSRTRASLASHA
jgi:hypothetical protein